MIAPVVSRTTPSMSPFSAAQVVTELSNRNAITPTKFFLAYIVPPSIHVSFLSRVALRAFFKLLTHSLYDILEVVKFEVVAGRRRSKNSATLLVSDPCQGGNGGSPQGTWGLPPLPLGRGAYKAEGSISRKKGQRFLCPFLLRGVLETQTSRAHTDLLHFSTSQIAESEQKIRGGLFVFHGDVAIAFQPPVRAAKE